MVLVSNHVYDICVLDIDESALCLEIFFGRGFPLALALHQPAKRKGREARERGERKKHGRDDREARQEVKEFCGIAE